MGKILIPGGGGGGVSSDDVTVKQSDVPVGLTAVTFDSDDEIVEGTLTTTVTSDKVLKDETFYNTETHQKESGTIESMEAQTITPGASAQTVSCTGKYMTGDVTINAVAGLSAGNIANGVTVGGVAGTYKGLGNATQAQVLSGRTFSTASLSNASGTMTNYSGYTSTSNYVSSTFRSGTTGYVFASPGGTGYYTTGSYLRIPATNLSAANIKKGVTVLGITGTFEGYTAGTLDVYNRGTWGSGYSISNIAQNPSTGYVNGSITAQTSAIMVRSPTQRTDHSWSYHCYVYLNKAINLAAYKTVNIIMSHTYANKNYTDYMYGYVGSSHGTSDLASTNFTASNNEVTISINVSNINVNGYLWVYFFRTSGKSESESYEERYQTAYIHRIWFTN